MNICVLCSSYETSDSVFSGRDPYGDPARFIPEHRWQRHLIEKATSTSQVRGLAQDGFDVFVNLCDGAWDEDRAGIDVVLSLERLGVAFTGADSTFYEPTREMMKRACHAWGLRTPAWRFVKSVRDVTEALDALRFPMIVKHANSYGSVGMERESKVTNAKELAMQVERMISTFGEALVEEFVDGREFTVLLAEAAEEGQEPLAFPPVEFHFPKGETFKHFHLKWESFEGMSCSPVRDEGLARDLAWSSQKFFAGLRGSGYARCDLRMDTRGELFMLEINPNCGIFYPEGQYGSADHILAMQPTGHRDFVAHILEAALRRQRRIQRPWKVQFDPRWGYGMVATRDLSPGNIIDTHEEAAHHLVTRSHVERHWDDQKRRRFRECAWPLTDEVFVMWGDDPSAWRPINHSCDPNAWLHGMDVAARRAIRAGEPITLDYATFRGPAMAPFACTCGAPCCRGQIRPEDHLAPWLADRYGEHLSDYVKRARTPTSTSTPTSTRTPTPP